MQPPITREPMPASPDTPRLLRLADLLADFDRDALELNDARRTGAPRGPLSGLPHVDAELGGAFGSGLHIIHAQPGAGKTAFCWQAAATCDCPALFVTCEMGPLELLKRLAARVTNTYLGRLKSGELPPEEAGRLVRRAVAEVPDLVLLDATRAPAPPSQILEAAEATRGNARHLLLIVDSIHSWAEAMTPDGGATEYDGLNAALAALRAIAHKLACPVLAVAERNRATMAKGGLNAGAGSRKLEYGAETVLDLKRDLDTRPDGNGEVPVTLAFSKNRNGAAGREVELLFHGALQRFREA